MPSYCPATLEEINRQRGKEIEWMVVADDFAIDCAFSSSQSLHRPNICEVRSLCKGKRKKEMRKYVFERKMTRKCHTKRLTRRRWRLITVGAAVSLLQQPHTHTATHLEALLCLSSFLACLISSLKQMRARCLEMYPAHTLRNTLFLFF